jgi:CheY-like chemotaxis protein
LIRVLRADPETRNVAILVMSANAQALEARAERFREEGINSLGKPYELDELLGLIRQQLPAPEVVCES